MQLEVEEHVEAPLLEGGHDRGAAGVVEGHADLNPFRLAAERLGELHGLFPPAIEGDDDTVGGVRACESAL